jgi:membrane associated rhomboid family serine protease
MGIFDDIKQNFRQGNYVIRLIYINVAVFLVVGIANLLSFLITRVSLDAEFDYWLAYPSNFGSLIFRPWTIITYMFMHASIWHILFNLLWLYWFGQIFLQFLDQKKLLSVYLLGGFAGALLYSITYNIFPVFEYVKFGSSMVGASAAIMAVVISISTIMPGYTVNLFLFGPVKLKYIAIVTIILDLLSIQSSNAGGHIAHLGGAAFGYFFGIRYIRGKDITNGFTKFLNTFFGFFKPREKLKVNYRRTADDMEYNKIKVDKQKEIDRILDKISKGGYESLSKEEKDFLFHSSN